MKYSESVLEKLKEKGKSINYIIVTHNHRDHIGGFQNFIHYLKDSKKFKGVIFWLDENMESSPLSMKLVDVVEKNNIKYYNPGVNNGNRILFNENIKILFPLKGEIYDYTDINRNSIVLAFKIKESYVVFTGDAPAEIEVAVLNRNKEILKNAIVIKLGHHGSSTSSDKRYINSIEKDNLEKVLCCCREDWSHKPPHEEKISEVERCLEIAVSCTGKNNLKKDIRIICEINKDGKIDVSEEEF